MSCYQTSNQHNYSKEYSKQCETRPHLCGGNLCGAEPPCVGKLVAGGVEAVAGTTEEHQDSSFGSSARINCGGRERLMLGSILGQRELLCAIVSLHCKSECSFAVAWRKGDERRLEKSTLLVYQADYFSKDNGCGSFRPCW